MVWGFGQAHGSTLVTRESGQEPCRWWMPSAWVKTVGIEARGNAIMVKEERDTGAVALDTADKLASPPMRVASLAHRPCAVEGRRAAVG
jgi:hypothetical protein